MRTRPTALALVLVAACAGGSPRAERANPSPPPVARTEPTAPIPPPPHAPAPEALPPATETTDAAVARQPQPQPSPPVTPECIVGRKRGGASLSDIVDGRTCRAPRDKWIDPFDTREFSIAADPPSLSVQRGAHAEIFVQIDVKGTKDALLQLRMGCQDEPAEVSIHDGKGKRIDWVGDLPDLMCSVDVVQVVVPAGDGVSLRVPFTARRSAWKPADAAPRDAGPLPAGKFELRLKLPFEKPGGKEHELRVPLEVTP